MADNTVADRPYAMLTDDQRKLLKNNGRGYDRKQQHHHRTSMVERVRESLRDFQLLSEYMQEKQRDKIFDHPPFSGAYNDLDTDISRTIEFLYVGLKGQARFRRPLTNGISRGEVKLGNVEYPGQALPRFNVYGLNHSINKREAVELVESRDWSALESPDLFEFIRTATQAKAINFEAIKAFVDRYEEFETQNPLLNSGETIEYGKEFLQEAFESRAMLAEHGDEFQEYLQHREEFREWLAERQD